MLLLLLKKLDDYDNNYDDNCSVSSALLSESLSARSGAPSGCDGADGHQVWKVVGNKLNKQQRTSDKGCPTVWRLGEVPTTQHCNSLLRYLIFCKTSE
jgi:hypothetical protein